eukprot:g5404.t1
MLESEIQPVRDEWKNLEILHRSRKKRVTHAERLIPKLTSFRKVMDTLGGCPDLFTAVLDASEKQLGLTEKFRLKFSETVKEIANVVIQAERSTSFHRLYCSENKEDGEEEKREDKHEYAPLAVRLKKAIKQKYKEKILREQKKKEKEMAKKKEKKNKFIEDEKLRRRNKKNKYERHSRVKEIYEKKMEEAAASPLKSLKMCEWGEPANSSKFALNLMNICMSKEDVDYMAWVLQSGIFFAVRVHCCYLNEMNSASLFDEMRSNKFITQLDLSFNKLKYKGAIALCENLEKNTTLCRLNLAGNMIGVQGGKAVANVIKQHPQLKDLSLFFNALGPVGANFIGSALRKTTVLKSLNLRYNEISAVGAQRLSAGLSRNRSLTELHIADNHIGKTGALAIAGSFRASIKQLAIAFGFDPYEKRRKKEEEERKLKALKKKREEIQKERDDEKLAKLAEAGLF